RVAGYAIDQSLPEAVGAFIHWLLTESKWMVTERTTRDELPAPVPVQPRHVCVLFRRFLHFGRDVTAPYVEALESRGVPHLLLDATRAHVGFVLRSAGEQALANVLHIAELARQYEMNGGISFRGFVEELRAEAEGGHAAEAPILEEGSEGVRLMTAHKAKGLEFPVVVLADMTAKLNNDRADRLIDREHNACYLRLGRWTPIELATHEPLEVARDEAEGVRVAYVAATRARDLLVVPAVGDVGWDGGWAAPLRGALSPPRNAP